LMTPIAGHDAAAEVSITGTFGYWATFAGKASDDKPLCGVRSDWVNVKGGPMTAMFMLKYFGGPEIAMQITRVGWHVPRGQG
jgi:hypothetical protein